MSFARATKTSRVPLRVWAVYLTVLGLLLLFFALIAHFARTRLAQKLTGPQYFQVCAQNDQMPALHISATDARMQLDRIIKERKLAPAVAAEINHLIDQLAAPASANVQGPDHVSAVQLNLALDKLQ